MCWELTPVTFAEIKDFLIDSYEDLGPVVCRNNWSKNKAEEEEEASAGVHEEIINRVAASRGVGLVKIEGFFFFFFL